MHSMTFYLAQIIQLRLRNHQIINLNKASNIYDNKTFSQLLELLGFRIRKRLLAEHALNIQKVHDNPLTNTCPSQIQVDKFFVPYPFHCLFNQ